MVGIAMQIEMYPVPDQKVFQFVKPAISGSIIE
jgi:hypothetical protein